jgi:hypothetical protein
MAQSTCWLAGGQVGEKIKRDRTAAFENRLNNRDFAFVFDLE